MIIHRVSLCHMHTQTHTHTLKHLTFTLMAFSSLPSLSIAVWLVLWADSFGHCYSIHKNYSSLFSFGDSLTDTGNLLASGCISFPSIGQYPYGMTYFGRPTGRCSDGRLIVDFIGTTILLESFSYINFSKRKIMSF
jgi:hypothetical protein